MSLAYALAMFNRTSFTEVASALGAELSLPASSLAWIGSAFFWVYLGVQVPAGVLVDVAGPRYVSAAGSAAMALGAGLFACSSQPLALAAARGLCAAGAVCVFLALIAFCSERLVTGSMSALGRALLIGNLGGVASGAPLAWGIGWLGWREVWWLLAACSVATCVAAMAHVGEGRVRRPVAEALRDAVPGVVRSLRRGDVYLGAGALAGLAGAFHAFSGFGAHRWIDSWGLGVEVEGTSVSIMVGGFALGAWGWGRIGDSAAVRDKVVRFAPLAALALWGALAAVRRPSLLALDVLLACAGVLCAAFGNVYAMLDQLAPASAKSATKATANCGIALGAALAQVAQGELPGRLAVLPCVALAALGACCCWVLALRCRPRPALATD